MPNILYHNGKLWKVIDFGESEQCNFFGEYFFEYDYSWECFNSIIHV